MPRAEGDAADFPGDGQQLRSWDPKKHAPCVGLINPKSGGLRGASILTACRSTDYFCDHIFSALDVIDGSALDAFRQRLDEAKSQARASAHPGCRPRLICGGGDGTASLAIYLVFRALLRGFGEEEGDEDERSGGGGGGGGFFAWTDEELRLYFPALVQLPLGTGNDLAGVLGWGRRAPSVMGGWPACCGCASQPHLDSLACWFDEALSLTTPVLDFNVWGFMPPSGSSSLDVKLCEVERVEHKLGSPNYIMKPPGPAVPFLMLLYGCFGFSAHVVARFELERTRSRWMNFLAYSRIAGSLILGLGRRPRQLLRNLEGLTADIVPEERSPFCEALGASAVASPYLPPRRSRFSEHYHEVGFLNLWSTRGGLVRGVERANCRGRWCAGERRQADFGDGLADFYRERGLRSWVKTGTHLQTDRASQGTFRFAAAGGKGIFFQFDGEGRFAFHPRGESWSVHVRHVLTVPVVVHPSARPDKGAPSSAGFRFVGTPEEVETVQTRICRWVCGDLVDELNATAADIVLAGLPLAKEVKVRVPARPAHRFKAKFKDKRAASVNELWAADSLRKSISETWHAFRGASVPVARRHPPPRPEVTRGSNSAPHLSHPLTPHTRLDHPSEFAGSRRGCMPGRARLGCQTIAGCLGRWCSSMCTK